MSRPQSSLIISIADSSVESVTDSALSSFSDMSNEVVSPDKNIFADKEIRGKDMRIDSGILSGTISKYPNGSLQLQVTVDDKLQYRVTWVKDDCVTVYCNKEKAVFRNITNRRVTEDFAQFIRYRGLFEGLSNGDAVSIESYSEAFWKMIGI